MSQCRHWCFTINNWTPAVFQYVTTPRANIKFLIVGKEVGASGTPHLQGYAMLTVKKGMNQAKKDIVGAGNHAHMTAAKGSPQDNIDYCSKGEIVEADWKAFGKSHPTYGLNADVTEIGVRPKGAAQKGDTIYDSFLNYVAENVGKLNEDDMAASNYEFFCKHQDRVDATLQRDINDSVRCDIVLRPWQQAVYDYWVCKDVGDRRILWIVDPVGNLGKSKLGMYCFVNRPNTQLLKMGKVADMGCAINNSNDVFFINIPRTKQDKMNYEVLEDLKDGLVWSPKYKSMMKMFRKSPNVIITMNFMPDMTALSEDRYVILLLEDDTYSCTQVPELNAGYVPPEPLAIIDDEAVEALPVLDDGVDGALPVVVTNDG
jgi:Putative viral replication protein